MQEKGNIEYVSNGLDTYDHLVNNIEECFSQMDEVVEKLIKEDSTGQYLTSSARFLSSLDRIKYQPWVDRLIEGAIEKDRERKYIGSLLEAIWGPGYRDHISELCDTDNNFRRIYKRIYPSCQL